jgi:hypothetical protein
LPLIDRTGSVLTVYLDELRIVEMDSPVAPRTERVLFNPLKLQRQAALATVQRVAARQGLRIDSVDERPRRLSVDVRVTVTGVEDSIKAFAEEAGGRREGDPPHTLRRWAGGIVEGILANWP